MTLSIYGWFRRAGRFDAPHEYVDVELAFGGGVGDGDACLNWESPREP